MNVRFSRLHGRPVRDGDTTLGRIVDITLRADGDNLIADQLVLVPSWWWVVVVRLHPRAATTVVAADDILAITRREVQVNACRRDDR